MLDKQQNGRILYRIAVPKWPLYKSRDFFVDPSIKGRILIKNA
jgi:hypothetical protein